MMANGFKTLLTDVINAGLCTGCGTCVAVCPKGNITFDQEKEKPILRSVCNNRCSLCLTSCPGKDIPMPVLEKFLFGRRRNLKKETEVHFGISKRFARGHATDSNIRKNGSSGGIVTALLVYGIEKGLIDGAIVAGMDEEQPWKTVPKFAVNTEEVCRASRSKYVIVPNNVLLREAQRKEIRRLALVGCPCHIHGLRKIQFLRQPRLIAQKVVLAIGLYCGMNYPFEATRHLVVERFGFRSHRHIKRLEYRGGDNNQYFVVEKKDGRTFRIPNEQRKNFFMLMCRDRCNMCFDWAADLADLSVGDIFYPGTTQKVPDWSDIIVRTREGQDWILNAQRSGYLQAFPSDPACTYGNSGLETKKHGSVYKLLERTEKGWPVPNYHLPLKVLPFPKGNPSIPLPMASKSFVIENKGTEKRGHSKTKRKCPQEKH